MFSLAKYSLLFPQHFSNPLKYLHTNVPMSFESVLVNKKCLQSARPTKAPDDLGKMCNALLKEVIAFFVFPLIH